MTFSERAKTKALAIVHIFETAKPFGDYGAVAVLSDGAGFSVGINQFTHRSGSLAKVIMRFMALGGEISAEMSFALPDFKSGKNIAGRSGDRTLRKELQSYGTNPLWQQAQREIAFECYLKPALDACKGSNFKYPLSLAVIYDSINQGSFPRVRDKVTTSDKNEKAWIAEYCADRKSFLGSSRKPIVRSTVYRPNFFLGQIAHGNWDLDLPLVVNGHKLTESLLFSATSTKPASDSEPQITSDVSPDPSESLPIETTTVEASDGSSAVSTTTSTNQQDINIPAEIESAKPYNEIGLKDTLKNDAKSILPANIGLQTVSEWIQQTTGWPPWVSALLPKLAIVAVCVTVVWILYRFAAWGMHHWAEKERIRLMAMINSDVSRRDVTIT